MSDHFKEVLQTAEFSEEFFVAEFQSRLSNMLDDKGISRAELARKLGVSRARVTQIFSDDASNFTLRLIFRSFAALDEEPAIVSKAELEKLKKCAEEAQQARPRFQPALEPESGLSAALLVELLRANAQAPGMEQERSSRRNDSARRWAESGSNVVPLPDRERVSG